MESSEEVLVPSDRGAHGGHAPRMYITCTRYPGRSDLANHSPALSSYPGRRRAGVSAKGHQVPVTDAGPGSMASGACGARRMPGMRGHHRPGLLIPALPLPRPCRSCACKPLVTVQPVEIPKRGKRFGSLKGRLTIRRDLVKADTTRDWDMLR